MKTLKDQSGFSVIEVTLVIIIAALIGGIGFFVYHVNSQASDTYDNASQTSSQQPAVKVKTKAGTEKTTTKSTTNSDSSTLKTTDSSITPTTTTDATDSMSANQ